MTRERLETLTREELVDLIVRLQVGVTELEAQLASKKPPPPRPRGQARTSSNSSVPPSSQKKPPIT